MISRVRVPKGLGGFASLAAFAAFPQMSLAQVTELRAPPAVHWVSTDVVAPGVIQGVVSDVDSGKPIAGASVRLVGTQYGAITDSAGRFSVATEYPETNLEIKAEMIGYLPARDSMRVRPGRGIALQIGLRAHDPPVCGLMVCSGAGCLSGVRVLVRDVMTGGPPERTVRLVVRSGELADTVTATPEGTEQDFWMSAGEMLGVVGPFDVELQAAGYAPWRTSGVLILPRECQSTGASPPQYAWLLPGSGQSD